MDSASTKQGKALSAYQAAVERMMAGVGSVTGVTIPDEHDSHMLASCAWSLIAITEMLDQVCQRLDDIGPILQDISRPR